MNTLKTLFFLALLTSSLECTKTIFIGGVPGGSSGSDKKYLGARGENFLWAGKLSGSAAIEAANRLASRVIEYVDGEEEGVKLVCHSFGGNIASLTTQIIALATMNRDAIKKKKIKIMSEEMSRLNWWQQFIPADGATDDKSLSQNDYFKLLNAAIELVKGEIQKTKNLPKKLIKRIIMAGTPINRVCYTPNTSVVESLYSFRSENDFIQPAAWLYKRTHNSESKKIKDIRLWFNGSQPGHNQYPIEELVRILDKLEQSDKQNTDHSGSNHLSLEIEISNGKVEKLSVGKPIIPTSILTAWHFFKWPAGIGTGIFLVYKAIKWLRAKKKAKKLEQTIEYRNPYPTTQTSNC